MHRHIIRGLAMQSGFQLNLFQIYTFNIFGNWLFSIDIIHPFCLGDLLIHFHVIETFIFM